MHLIIAEKNIAAKRISGILAAGKGVTTGKEGGVNTYRFGDTVVIGLRGHVVEIDFEPGYSNWRSETKTPRTLIDAGTIKTPTEKKIVTLIRKLAKKADLVTMATDFDTEGELIGKEAYEIVRAVNKKVEVKRARFSAITGPEITQAFDNPGGLDFDLAAAGESRQVIDLVWGASLTRFISIAAHRGGSNILSVGRVQSPTLAMIVDREEEIEAFVPEPYWMLSILSEKAGGHLEAHHTHGRFTDFTEASEARVRTVKPLVVTSIKEGSKVDHAPTPFDTTAYIVTASRQLHISASKTMRIAEELYMNGLISYPRTDNTVYPASLDLDEVLNELDKSVFRRDVAWVRAHQRPTPTRGKKTSTDHPPIHPTGAASPDNMDEAHWKVYELVVRRFLATLSPDARWKTMKCLLDAGSEPYAATGSRISDEGYRHVYPYSQAKETVLPPLHEGEALPLLEVSLEEKETQPPPRYSQSRLIQTMEELGLGTKSTRPDVIGKLISRRYVEGTPLRPTLVGKAVIESLEGYAGTITRPEMTRTLEAHMEEIKETRRARDDVIDESKGMLHGVFDNLEAHEQEIGNGIMERTDEERIIGKCPVCGQDLRLRSTKGMAQFIGCSGYPECTFNIGLPGAMWGRAIREDKICEIHGLHHVKLIKKASRPWDFGCPLCTHIESNLKTLKMIPSLDEEIISGLHSVHIYTVYEVSKTPAEKLVRVLGIGLSEAETILDEAEEVLVLLRKRSELRKFVRKTIPPRRGRSHSKVVNAFHDAGINEIGDLASKTPKKLTKMHVSEKEAEDLISGAREIHNTRLLKEYGVPAVSLKKYMAAGIMTPADFCSLHPAYLSTASGLRITTVHGHVEKVCTAMGVGLPVKVTQKRLDAGREELLSTPGLGEAALLKLYRAGIVDVSGLLSCDPALTAGKSGISEDKIKKYIAALKR